MFGTEPILVGNTYPCYRNQWLSSSTLTHLCVSCLQWINLAEKSNVAVSIVRLGYLFHHFFRRRSKKTSKFRVTGFCEGHSPVTDEFPAQRPVTRKLFPFDDVIMKVRFRMEEEHSMTQNEHRIKPSSIKSSQKLPFFFLLSKSLSGLSESSDISIA